MKSIFISLVMIVTYFHPSYSQDVFELNLSMDKSIFVKGEPVQVGISLINVSKSNIYAESLGKTDLKIFDSKGQEVKRGGITHDYWGPFKNNLAPAEEDYNVVFLNNFFGNNYFTGLMVAMYFEPGIYTIEVEFYPSNNMNKIKDNILFEVKDVDGEELVVFKRLADILKFEIENTISIQNELKTADEFRYLFEAYPNSVYSPYILTKLSALYSIPLGDSLNAFWADKELVENFPWFVNSFNRVDRVVNKLNKDSDRIAYLKLIKNKSKGKLAEKIYEQKLQKLERK